MSAQQAADAISNAFSFHFHTIRQHRPGKWALMILLQALENTTGTQWCFAKSGPTMLLTTVAVDAEWPGPAGPTTGSDFAKNWMLNREGVVTSMGDLDPVDGGALYKCGAGAARTVLGGAYETVGLRCGATNPVRNVVVLGALLDNHCRNWTNEAMRVLQFTPGGQNGSIPALWLQRIEARGTGLSILIQATILSYQVFQTRKIPTGTAADNVVHDLEALFAKRVYERMNPNTTNFATATSKMPNEIKRILVARKTQLQGADTQYDGMMAPP